MNKLLALLVDPMRIASLPAPVLRSHPSRMLSSGPRCRLALRTARPRSSITPAPPGCAALPFRECGVGSINLFIAGP